MVRVGVVGVGHLGRLHTRVYSQMGFCELVGVYDVDQGRAAAVAAEFGTEAFVTLDALLDGIDAVSLATPTSTHHDVGRRCLESGAHLLVEKPIARTVQEARDLVDVAGDRSLVLQVGHIERFNAAVRAAMAVLEGPKFIEVHRLGVFVPRGTDVAVVLDLMIHDIDLILATVDSEVRSIEAVGVSVLSPSIDIANARLSFADGCVANITASRVSREKVRKIRFFQPDTYVTVDTLKPRAQVFRRKSISPETLLGIARGDIEGGLEDVVHYEDLPLDDAEPLRLELESFVEAVSGGGSPVVSGEDGLRALEVALEILRQTG
ncbi:MAG: Gfo/Idh/MocA family oxidoreductase [Candidatus Eisenbacteria bacterium]|nr:Gfo/Idh/MocA family oxidoreductase [Candidatus Eisenbacteria bacterium]